MNRSVVLVQSYAVYLVLPCTMLIFCIGYYLGSVRVKDERESILRSLSAILQSADELSRLGNRKAFDEALNYRISRWKRQGDRFALIVIDVDRFKWINDTHGHQAGDRVVSGVGELLRSFLPEDRDCVVRYGGDEFTILLECEDRASVIEIAEQILAAAETQDFSAAGHGERVAITFSMGMAVVRERDTFETLFRRADNALYQAKSAGRNCLRVESEAEEVEHVETVLTS